MKTFYVRNIKKAAELELALRDKESFYKDDVCLTLRLIDGQDGHTVRDVRYKTVRGLLRNSGRKVVARFSFLPASEGDGRGHSFPIRFEATY